MVPRLSLLAKFSLLAFLCVAGLGAALFVALRGDIRDRELETAREKAATLAVGVSVDLLTVEELDAGLDLRTLAAMDEAIEEYRVAGEIVTAKVFDRKGRLAYSAERDQIGEDGGEHVREALQGKVIAELEAEESEHVEELGGGLYEVYVPLRFSGDGPPDGAFEIYLPYEPVAAQIERDTRKLAPVLAGGLAVLYLLLFPIVARASRTLRRHARDSRHQALHDDLTGVANRRQLLARLEHALRADGRPVSGAWPKLTSDWMVANPLIGSFGGSERKVVVALTRSGTMLAYRTDAPTCSPSSWPRFHHDEANAGDLRRDATAPGRPTALRADSGRLAFASPGDDLLCGRPAAYEVSAGGAFTRVDAETVERGETASVPLPARARAVSVRAVDEQGNVGRSATISLR